MEKTPTVNRRAFLNSLGVTVGGVGLAGASLVGGAQMLKAAQEPAKGNIPDTPFKTGHMTFQTGAAAVIALPSSILTAPVQYRARVVFVDDACPKVPPRAVWLFLQCRRRSLGYGPRGAGLARGFGRARVLGFDHCPGVAYAQGNSPHPGSAEGQRAERLRPVFLELANMSARKAAEELNRRGIPAPAGGNWFATQVIRVRERLSSKS